MHRREDVGIQLKGGGSVRISTPYLTPKRTRGQQKPGRRRGVGRRGTKATGCQPVVQRLGVIAGASPALCEDTTLACLSNTFDESAVALQRRGVAISCKRLRTISEKVGKAALAEREAATAEGADESTADRFLAGQRIVIAVDGGRIRLREEKPGRPRESGRHGFDGAWREPKLYTVYAIDEQGRKIRGTRSLCDGTIGAPDDIFRLLVADLRRHGASDAREIHFLSDGAPWIQGVATQLARELALPAEKISRNLDFYHAVEHLSTIAEALGMPEENERKKWLTNMTANLRKLAPAAFLEKLKRCRRKGSKIIRREIQYFKNNALESTEFSEWDNRLS